MIASMRPAGKIPAALLPVALLSVALSLVGCTQSPERPMESVRATEPPLLPTPAPLPAEPPALRSGSPQRYTVVPGDTLWDLARQFLDSPWRWPEIWRRNPQIDNPDLIYPGDVIEVFYEEGQPRLRLADPLPGQPRVVKLSPQVRTETLVAAIPTLPRDVIEPFLSRSRVLIEPQWLAAPYVIATADNRVLSGSGERIYARGMDTDQSLYDQPLYQVFRPGDLYEDPFTGEPLGYSSVYLGEARLVAPGDPATLVLTDTRQAVRAGDRLFPLPQDGETLYRFIPHPVPVDTEGAILAVLEGFGLIGQYQSVVLNLGEDQVEPGHVLGIYKASQTVTDTLTGQPVALPEERIGLLMIYDVFDRTSYGLITDATDTIRVLDRVGSP